jgi:phosphoenolpyruvate carboxylase
MRVLGFLAFALACGSSTPVDFAGTYTMTVVNGQNPCNFANWTAGDSDGNIPVTITQDATVTSLAVGGLTGAYLDLVFSTSSFNGMVTSDTFTASAISKQATQQTCVYNVNLAIQATLTNTTNLNGTLTYTATTNNDPTCGVLDTCSQQQTLIGTRTAQ